MSLFTSAPWNRLFKNQSSLRPTAAKGRQLMLEPLEDRRLLSLVGVVPTYPLMTYDNTGTLSYNASAQSLTFALDASPLTFKQTSSSSTFNIIPARSFAIDIRVDNAGNLIGGVAGSDLTVVGTIDANNNGVADPGEYTGTLLTGEVTQFGFLNAAVGTTDRYDFRFTPTGGSLYSLYAGSDIGITTTSESSTFSNLFSVNFTGRAKGNLGSVTALWSSLGGYVYNDGANDDGIKQPGEAGIAHVSLSLTGTDIGGNPVSLTTTTDSLGAYSFTQLRAGTYTITETQPMGWLDGKDTQGTPGTGTVGNDVISNIVLNPNVNGQNNNFGEVPMLPGVSLVKLTNGAHDPNVPVGSSVTWTYEVTNTGNTALSAVTVSDDAAGVTPVYASGDANTNDILDVGETWVYSAAGIATAGQYANTGSVVATATDATGMVNVLVTSSDVDYYFGVDAQVGLTKLTNDSHNPNVAAGTPVTWTYQVSNLGNVALQNVAVADDQGVVPVYQSGDANSNGLLDVGELWLYTAAGTAIVGQYTNGAAVTAIYTDESITLPVSDTAADGYFGVQPQIALTKLTNGSDNNGPTGPELTVGSAVTWTYQVKNTGNVAITDVVVKDSDLSIAPVYQSGDDGNAVLDPGETWTYTAEGVAVEGQYFNTGTATGSDATGTVQTAVTATDVDYYLGKLLPSRLAGFVYSDVNDNGIYEPNLGESGIAGAVVSLSGTDDLGAAVTLSVVTGQDGSYAFENLRPGTYSIVEAQPDGYLDGTDAIGTQGGQVSNDLLHDIVLTQGINGTANNFGELLPAKLDGFVWLDANNNGEIDFGERAIANVTVTLTGTNDLGQAVSLTALTDANGAYDFSNLRPGTYAITETQPAGYNDGLDSIGTQGGTVTNDRFSNISLSAGTIGINNNFGERPTSVVQLSQGMTATIGFWHNKNGQALIKSLNGSSNSTALGNWLAANFANMYGVTAGANNLAGKTNAQVAAKFLDLFSVKGQKLDAQALAIALAVYATDSDLAGGTTAAGYGFIVNTAGTAAAVYNVGSYGSAFGVANNTTLTIMNLLTITNSYARKGVLWDLNANGSISAAEQALRDMANIVFTDINETGDIN
jgi:hypothetical protein